MQDFGLAKEAWLRDRLGLELANGIPSDDTFRRLFARLDPEQFGRCLLSLARSLHEYMRGEIIAIDGKALRLSFDVVTGQGALHLVSAWASEAGLALGQVAVDKKSNEITAIPALLKLLDIAGCVITMDAMGCQRAIARPLTRGRVERGEQIVDKRADYLLSLKGNQSTLHEDVKLFFEDARAHGFYQGNEEQRIAHGYCETTEKDHERVETRRCWVVQGEELGWLWQKQQWAGLASIGAVECERHIGDRVQTETRYFISSLSGSVKKFAHAVRAHWGIENRLHWVLDMAFDEDDCGIWHDHAPENLGTLRRMALNLLRQEKTSKRGLKARSKRASWDNDYLLRIMLQATSQEDQEN